jgi:hypothetical protein
MSEAEIKDHLHVLQISRAKHRGRSPGSLLPLVVGLAALIWVVTRVVPKPSRASYPCMQVAMSLAAGFLAYLGALVLSALSLGLARRSLLARRYGSALILLFVGLSLPLFFGGDIEVARATYPTADHPANQPTGEPGGIFPGRVVWVHDPDATNQNCLPGAYGHGWFLNENNDQRVIDRMLSDALRVVSGEVTDTAAWQAVFRYHNGGRGKGAIGYQEGESVFIKINATSSWSGNINPSDFSKIQNEYYGISETSPHLVLSVLRQLVNVAGVAQEEIWVGDPLRHIYKHCYDMWHAEFPDIHYLDHDGWGGREKMVPSQTAVITYSDRGSVLREGTWSDASVGDTVWNDYLYTIFENAEYMINIPTLKGHKHAGITAFPKNHFGSHTREDAKHLHGGLVAPEVNNPRRQGYGLYRVQVDLMGHALLGEKNLLYLLDGLWTSDMEVNDPDKFMKAPFNDDWMSSIFLSLDPVAVESVGFDFLRAEFTADRGLATHPQMEGVDDYLHQAADSTAWPQGIVYDPDDDGTAIASLGVHEHWNNPVDKQYSRNLGTGSGIELVTPGGLTDVADGRMPDVAGVGLEPNYPNPFNPSTVITAQWPAESDVRLVVYDLLGTEVALLADGRYPAGVHEFRFDGTGLASGVYLYRLEAGSFVQTRRMLLVR